MCPQHALELVERLLVERDIVDVVYRYAVILERGVDGIDGEFVVMLLPYEAFFFRGEDHAPVLEQRGGRVVIETGDSEYVHELSSD